MHRDVLKMKISPIKFGFCPNCDCRIANGNESNELYAEFWVLFDDGSNSNYAICKKCLEKLTMPEVIKINKMQRYTWGMEIISNPLSFEAFYTQLKWYISCGSLLEIVKFANTKEKLYT